MARLGRSQPIPVTHVGRKTFLRADADLPAFELEWDFPTIRAITPAATVPLPSFSLGWEFPPIGFSVGLTSFALAWEFPEVSAVVPVNPGDALTGDPGQVEWNGTLWGAGTGFVVQSIDGWRSLPQLDNLNVERPSRHGAWAARRLAQQRLVTIRLQPQSFSDPTLTDDLLAQLDAVTGVLEDETEWPLVIKGYGEPQLAFGSIADRDIPMNDLYSVGAPSVSLLIVCSDPRRYSITQTGVDLPLNAEIELANAGNVATHPILRIPGPVEGPTITNQTLDRLLQFDVEVAEGERLVIDTNAGTAVIGEDSQIQTLTGSSVPLTEFVLGRGTSVLSYTALEGGSSPVVCLYRDSWL